MEVLLFTKYKLISSRCRQVKLDATRKFEESIIHASLKADLLSKYFDSVNTVDNDDVCQLLQQITSDSDLSSISFNATIASRFLKKPDVRADGGMITSHLCFLTTVVTILRIKLLIFFLLF